MPGKFDTLKIPVNESRRMVIKHPVTKKALCDKGGKEAFIELLSIDSSAARKHKNEARQRRMMTAAGSVSAEEIEVELSGMFAALTCGWFLLGLDGEPLNVEFSVDTARELYEVQELAWIRSDVDAFVSNISHWVPPAVTAV
jgi:hypothetical protein